jgi:GAF domain-containing protein
MKTIPPQTSSEPPEEDSIFDELRRLITSIEASGRGILPRTNLELLGSIVEAAARIFNAAAASIALVDEAGQNLEFKVAYGSGKNEVVGMRIPINKGIAGYVAMTGQPIAVSNVQQDSRFNKDFAQSTGYVPKSILATPLLSGEKVIGVMEVLDKINAPSFGIQDMELLGIFANQAAIAIHQSQQIKNIDQAIILGLQRICAAEDANSMNNLSSFLESMHQSGATEHDLQTLAELFFEISSLGDAERKVFLNILRDIAEYSRSRRRPRTERSVSFPR